VKRLDTYMPSDDFVPFSNGSEHMMWLGKNCERGKGGCRNYKPNATSSRHGCPIEVAVAIATATGVIPARVGLRGGWLEPASDGRLQRAEEHPPTCPEYRGYDEPDDRPRRGPRPPEGQQDLLDPRNQPTPTRSKVPS
jgi:hypothetical protein